MAIECTAIDFETANGSSASACSVGLVKVRGGEVVGRASWLIRPPAGHDEFLDWNVRIHGIRAADVVAAAGWAETQRRILDFAAGDVLVAHNMGFDRRVLQSAAMASGLPVPITSWLCSLRVARRTYHLDSYRLPVAARAAGFDDFTHHDAAADAEACAAIIIHAALRHGVDDIGELARVCSAQIQQIGEPSVGALTAHWGSPATARA